MSKKKKHLLVHRTRNLSLFRAKIKSHRNRDYIIIIINGEGPNNSPNLLYYSIHDRVTNCVLSISSIHMKK